VCNDNTNQITDVSTLQLCNFMHSIIMQSNLVPVPAGYADEYPVTSGSGRISKIWIRYIPKFWLSSLSVSRTSVVILKLAKHGRSFVFIILCEEKFNLSRLTPVLFFGSSLTENTVYMRLSHL